MLSQAILIVEDDVTLRKVVETCLTLRGFDVQTCPDVKAACEELRLRPFGVVLTDYRMPHADGSAMVRAVNEFAPGTPVAIMTGNPEDVAPICFEGPGSVTVIEKPFLADELARHLRSALARRAV